jgi:hypothetical protein
MASFGRLALSPGISGWTDPIYPLILAWKVIPADIGGI